jgi:hypothetical protein
MTAVPRPDLPDPGIPEGWASPWEFFRYVWTALRTRKAVAHDACLGRTAELERDLFGRVVSDSVRDHLEGR